MGLGFRDLGFRVSMLLPAESTDRSGEGAGEMQHEYGRDFETSHPEP